MQGTTQQEKVQAEEMKTVQISQKKQHPHYPKEPIVIEKQELHKKADSKEDIQEKTEQDKARVQLEQYFNAIKKGKNVHDKYSRSAHNMIEIVEHSIFEGIKVGLVQIPDQSADLQPIITAVSRVEETDPEKIRRREIQIQLEYLQKQIQRENLKRITDSRQQEEKTHQKLSSVFSKTQHRNFLKRLEKQKKELIRKKKQLEEEEKQRIQYEQNLKKISQEEKILQQRSQKMKKLSESKTKREEEHQNFMKQQEQTNKTVKQLKSKKLLYKIIEDKYQSEVVLPMLEQKKKKLKDIREYNKAFNVTDLNTHEKQYIRRREQQILTSHAKTKQKIDLNYIKPAKSERLAKILEEESIQAKIKEEQKRRRMQEKKYRKQEYAALLKQKYAPKQDPKLKEQMQKRLQSERKQKSPVQKPDRKLLGQNYLEEVKRMRKKSSNLEMIKKHNNSANMLSRGDASFDGRESFKPQTQTNYDSNLSKTKKYIDSLRMKRIEKLIKSSTADNIDRIERISKLQLQAEKLVEQQRRKEQIMQLGGKKMQSKIEQDGESINLLLASIKAKMGIIDLYNE